jgi:hypothetical protein
VIALLKSHFSSQYALRIPLKKIECVAAFVQNIFTMARTPDEIKQKFQNILNALKKAEKGG